MRPGEKRYRVSIVDCVLEEEIFQHTTDDLSISIQPFFDMRARDRARGLKGTITWTMPPKLDATFDPEKKE